MGSYNNKNISNEIKIRSNGSRFSQKNDFNSDTKTTHLVENKKGLANKGTDSFSTNANTKDSKKAKMIKLKENLRPKNERKKKKKLDISLSSQRNKQELSEKKLNKEKTRTLWYYNPKTLADMVPMLDDAMCDELRSVSGRHYPNNFIRQRLLAMSHKQDLSSRNFKSRKGFISYFSKVLLYEKHCPVKVDNINFRLSSNITMDEKIAQDQEKFLSEIEYSQQTGSDWNFKKKLAATLKPNTAYYLLLALEHMEIVNNRLVISLKQQVELSGNEKDIILSQANAVFNHRNINIDGQYVEAIEYIVNATNSNSRELEKKQELELPKGKWGKIARCFIEEHGIELYKHWLEPLHVEENNELVLLSSNSGMILDRIMEKYWQRMSDYSEMYDVDLNIRYSG